MGPFCKLQDPGLAAEWEPKQAVSHQLSERSCNLPYFANSVLLQAPEESPSVWKNASMNSAEKYCTVHNFGKTACNLKWAVSPSPRLRRRGPSCGAPPSGRLLSRGFERCFDWVGCRAVDGADYWVGAVRESAPSQQLPSSGQPGRSSSRPSGSSFA